MHNAQPSPIAPHRDNMIGICHAIGEDFGFNPLYLRIALAVTLLFSPEAMLVAYGSGGLLVLASRLLVRAKPRRATNVSQLAVTRQPTWEDDDDRLLAVAA